MVENLKLTLWNQFGASIDMLINVLSNCSEDYFIHHKRFYYIAFHSALFLDYYLTFPPTNFSPILPFTQMGLDERPKEAIDDLVPDKIYSKNELVEYVLKSRGKCQELIFSLTEEKLMERFTEGDQSGDMDYPILEILLYNLRHTQHHTAQLNMMIRQNLDKHMEWSFRTGDIDLNLE